MNEPTRDRTEATAPEASPPARDKSPEGKSEEYLERSQLAFLEELFATIGQGKEQYPELTAQALARIEELGVPTLTDSDWKNIESLDPEIKQARSSDADFQMRTTFGIRLVAWCSLAEALLSRSPLDALQLFVSEGVSPVMDRVFLAGMFLSPLTPLWSLAELRDQLHNFVDFLNQNRESIIQTGVPAQPFTQGPWLNFTLGNLYPTKPEILASLFHCRTIKAGGPKSRFACDMLPRFMILRGCCANEYAGCNCVDADFLTNLDAAAVKRIESDRARLFEMKIAILMCLIRHVEEWSATNLWETCLAQMTKTLLAADVDFYLDVDRIYTGKNVEDFSGLVNVHQWRNPGGLSQILYAIKHCQAENNLGMLAGIRESVRELEGFPSTNAISYFDHIGRPGKAILESAIVRFRETAKRAISFFTDLDRRVIDALRNEFEEEVIIRQKVKRGLVQKEKQVPVGVVPSGEPVDKFMESLISRVIPEFARRVMEAAGVNLVTSQLAEAQSAQSGSVKKFPPLDGLRWNEVRITFVSDDAIRIEARAIFKRFHFAEIGFKDGRTPGRPNRIWGLLSELAKRDGTIEPAAGRRYTGVQDAGKDAFKELRKCLRAIMSITDDPFFEYRKVKAYKTRFVLADERLADDQIQKQNAEQDY